MFPEAGSPYFTGPSECAPLYFISRPGTIKPSGPLLIFNDPSPLFLPAIKHSPYHYLRLLDCRENKTRTNKWVININKVKLCRGNEFYTEKHVYVVYLSKLDYVWNANYSSLLICFHVTGNIFSLFPLH